ncbi:MAG: hypothetical protein RR910_08795 [Acidaminococcaceae bacterium]
MSKIKLLLTLIDDVRAVADDLQAIADSMANNEPTEVKEENKTTTLAPKADKPKSSIKLEELRALLASKSQAGLGNEVRELIKKYDATKLSDVDPKQYAAIFAEAEVL